MVSSDVLAAAELNTSINKEQGHENPSLFSGTQRDCREFQGLKSPLYTRSQNLQWPV